MDILELLTKFGATGAICVCVLLILREIKPYLLNQQKSTEYVESLHMNVLNILEKQTSILKSINESVERSDARTEILLRDVFEIKLLVKQK